MKGSETKMIEFMEGVNDRYIIPVYQRKYDWKLDNCRQLYSDLKKVVQYNLPSHFFGSIVSYVVGKGRITEHHIIDGQQRITTMTLLLLAIRNLVSKGTLYSREDQLDKQIDQEFLISPWAAKGDRIKLRLVKGDNEALAKLFAADEGEYDRTSNLTINYNYFCETLLKEEEVPIDALYAAIWKLEIISITLDLGDNAQLIFESLNSTGMALSEGDKIRNYVLMGLSQDEQRLYYEDYWERIEDATGEELDNFLRDFLSLKRRLPQPHKNVYRDFKAYADRLPKPSTKALLDDLLKYARLYEKLLSCKSGLNSKAVDDCLYRIKRLEIIVTRPFFMEVLRLCSEGNISVDVVLESFLITESYLFRRNICEIPATPLNKIFVALNREILHYDTTANDYVAKLVYTLQSKRESGWFPDDEKFAEALTEKQVYRMSGKYKPYLFERFENYGTIETKDVYTHLDNNEYSIEHIMPQQLTPAWINILGPNYAEIHATWLHRLANLTLTGYNPNLSNNTFQEKRDAEKGGYKISGLKMNQKIAQKESWGLPELEERNREMVALAKEIWAYPETKFKPAQKELDSCTLDDEDFDLTKRNIAKYSYLNIEQPVASWIDMFERVVKILHQNDKSVLLNLVEQDYSLGRYFSSNEKDLFRAIQIDDHIYAESYTSTKTKTIILRRLFDLYKLERSSLTFYLKTDEKLTLES